MAKTEPYVIVHGGVHKTATSYVQSILQRNSGKLKKCGVYYIHHRDTRKDYTYPTQLNGYEKIGLDYRRKVSDDDLAKISKNFFKRVKAKPGGRIILSDENMPGHCGQCVQAGKLYSRRKVLIPIFAQNIFYPTREVHLAIRNYADFFASAYVEYLRSAKGDGVMGENEMKRAVLSRMPSWADFVAVVQEAFGDAKLILWRHEDFGALSNAIVGNLCGPEIDPGSLVMPKRSRGRPTASHRAVREILAEMERIGSAAALEKRVEIQEAYPRGPDYPGYDPWSETERAHLTRMYDRDVAEIKRRFDVIFLDPET